MSTIKIGNLLAVGIDGDAYKIEIVGHRDIAAVWIEGSLLRDILDVGTADSVLVEFLIAIERAPIERHISIAQMEGFADALGVHPVMNVGAIRTNVH